MSRWPAPVTAPAHGPPPPAERAVWYYSVTGTRRGPVTTAQLKSLVEAAALRETDLLWRKGMPAWVEAGTVPELFPPRGSAPPVPVPVPPTQTPEPEEEAEPAPRARPRPPRGERRGRRPLPRANYTLPFAIGAVVLLVAVGCLVAFFVWSGGWLQSHGTRLVFNGGELYYTSAVTRDEAERLGNHLVRDDFFNGDFKTVQLDREGRWYQVRMVVKKGTEHDAQFAEIAKLFAAELSRAVFAGRPVEIHLCDDRLRTLRTVVNPNVR